jgi:sugar O-acyltransferase (sialic acid O-acetyltransferase NeuD family)
VRDVVVIGAGGFGREVAQLLRDIERSGGGVRFAGYVDDDPRAQDRVPRDETWLGPLAEFERFDRYLAVCAVGDPKARAAIAARLKGKVSWATLQHPSVIVGDRCRIGPGSVICAGVVLTVDVTIGAHVHINLVCTIGHDVVIEDFATLSPGCGVSGNVHIGPRVLLGTQAVLLPGAQIGTDAIVGAGSVVLKAVPEGATVVGVPAKRLV